MCRKSNLTPRCKHFYIFLAFNLNTLSLKDCLRSMQLCSLIAHHLVLLVQRSGGFEPASPTVILRRCRIIVKYCKISGTQKSLKENSCNNVVLLVDLWLWDEVYLVLYEDHGYVSALVLHLLLPLPHSWYDTGVWGGTFFEKIFIDTYGR